MKKLLLISLFSINILGFNSQGTWPFLFVDLKKVKECYQENIYLLKSVEQEKIKTLNGILDKSFSDMVSTKFDIIDYDIKKAIKNFAQKHNCYAVININDANTNGVSYCHDDCNITEEIIKIINT